MPGEKYFFLNINLSYKLAGLEHASLKRARLFQEQLGITPTIVTTKYNNRLIDIREHFIQQGLLNEKIPVINMYEYFQGTYTDQRIQKKHPVVQDAGWTYKEVSGTNDLRVYRENRLLMYQKRTSSGNVHYINYFHNGKKVRRDGYDCNGFLSVVQVLHPETSRVMQETYYTVEGTPCIIKHYRETGKKAELSSIMLMDEDGHVTKVFHDEKELVAYWLDKILNTYDTYYLFVDKNRVYYEALQRIKKENHYIIPMIHAIHTKDAVDVYESKLNFNYASIFEDVQQPDAIVMLTKKQKQDVAKRFGEDGNYYAIPHALTTIPKPVSFNQRKRGRVVALARFSKEKRLDHMIHMFAKVVNEVPHAELEIYGYGSEKKNLEQLIDELKMEENIKIKPYVDQPREVYESARLSLLTSKGEGFSLVTMESLAHGCPVISYDINYGPSDMIKHGENGFLVPRDDEEAFVNYIIQVLTDEKLNERLSENAYRYSEPFHPQKVAIKWREMLEEVKKKEVTCMNKDLE